MQSQSVIELINQMCISYESLQTEQLLENHFLHNGDEAQVHLCYISS